jgi:tryptophanyl-tRNA synthetase
MFERAEPYMSNPKIVREIVENGTNKARQVAQATMRDVRSAMGLNY